jgi:hypothetical protein
MLTRSYVYFLGILLIAGSLFLAGCAARSISLVDFQTGQTIEGQLDNSDRSVTVTMPDGEILYGKYSDISGSTTVFGTGFGVSSHSHATIFSTSVAGGGASRIYALLRSSSSSLMMELALSYSEWTGHGYGEAITNDGRNYKVQF